MKRKETKKSRKKARRVEKAIKLTWSSLKSHLPWARTKQKGMPKKESPRFHKKCVQEYADTIRHLSKLY